MNRIDLARVDLNLLVTFEALMDLRSVTLAADRLGRTPSAISHALARLREQVGDPLLVKVGGKMQPSPFALRLIEDIRPLLRGIERVITPPAGFDPATSERLFRVAIPAMPSFVAALTGLAAANAPGVDIEWLPLGPTSRAAIAEERIDIGMLAPGTTIGEGLDVWLAPETRRYVFARPDHPALENWGLDAWLAYPHVVVGIGGAAGQTVEQAVARDGLQRRIGAKVTEFAGLAPLIARTDNLGTFAPIGIADDAKAYGLAILEPPIDIPPIAFNIVWSARIANDPAMRWIRETVIAAYLTATERTDAIIAEAEIVQVRP